MSTIYSSGTLYIRSSGTISTIIDYSTDQVNWINISVWPCTIINTDTFTTLKVIFTTDINIFAADNYFICGSSDIQFGSTSLNANGTRPVIQTSSGGSLSYPGFIKNGGIGLLNIGYINITIVNLVFDGTNFSPIQAGGWLAQQYFSNGAINNKVVNCSSKGTILTGGGIVGPSSARNGGSLYIVNCSSSCSAQTTTAAGIVGGNAQNVSVVNCFSTGNFAGYSCGGIFGDSCINCTATNCYSLGNIGTASGGIFGPGSEYCNAINCYSRGTIGTSGSGAGGIFGSGHTAGSAINCYSSGTINSGNGGIASDLGGLTVTNCYAANGTWSDSDAASNLDNTTNTWISIQKNTPYILGAFGATPYTLDVVTLPFYNVVNLFSQILIAGNSLSIVAAGYKTFQILSGGDPSGTITIDNTGKISTTASTPVNTYSLSIYGVDDYTTTTVVLTVTSNQPPTPTPTPSVVVNFQTVPPCCEANVCDTNPQVANYDEQNIVVKKSGKIIDKNVENFYAGIASGQRTVYSQPIFKSYYDYIQYLQGKTR
jgi:hypothetical protein